MKFEKMKLVDVALGGYLETEEKVTEGDARGMIVSLPDLDTIFKEKVFYDTKSGQRSYNIKRNPQAERINKWLKRGFDVVFAALFIMLIASWLFPLLAILIMIDSRGPAFYLQKRSGKNNRVFKCLKFRTMKFDHTAKFKAATKNDNRITSLGRFLRKSSLDEIPQFINVLLGDMSVVGPRPHAIETDMEYKKLIDRYDYRLAAKPGITGLAQVKGYRGETLRPRDMSNRIRIDIFYIENWTFVLDLRIIVLTVYNMLKGDKKAY